MNLLVLLSMPIDIEVDHIFVSCLVTMHCNGCSNKKKNVLYFQRILDNWARKARALRVISLLDPLLTSAIIDFLYLHGQVLLLVHLLGHHVGHLLVDILLVDQLHIR